MYRSRIICDGVRRMKTLLALVFVVLVALHSPTASAQSAAARSRSGASLPPACAPGGPNATAATIVVNGTYYVCTAPNKWSEVHGSEGDNAWTSNNRFCGPIPWADVSCYGARAPAGGVPSTSANCTKGNNQVVIAAPNTFQVNDGVTIYDCGATNTL